MFCTQCGTQVSDGAKFCAGCGAPRAASRGQAAAGPAPAPRERYQAPPQAAASPGAAETVSESPAAFNEGKTLISKMGSAEGTLGLIDGKILLTENALIFQPRVYQIAASKIVMPLADIAGIVKGKSMFVFDNKMTINLRSGGGYTLVFMTGRDAFINALEQQIKLAVP
ncbi:MAG: zinc-ribbon domain-containing protein [Treponema sp.]|nr:zinc-ribbon domain-containing protein [Treponema sp.]